MTAPPPSAEALEAAGNYLRRCLGRPPLSSDVEALAREAAETTVLRLADDQRLVVRQELIRAAHTLDAQARAASPRGNRQRALTQRAALLRSVAEQLA